MRDTSRMASSCLLIWTRFDIDRAILGINWLTSSIEASVNFVHCWQHNSSIKMIKILATVAALAIAVEGGILLGHGHHGHSEKTVDYHAHPKYEFKYGVEDHKTGDIKNQEEHRDGDSVHGHYTVAQPDGTTRVVSYHADKHSGFNADVKIHGHPIEHHTISHGHHEVETSHSGHHELSHSGHKASSHASLKQYHSEAHPIVVEAHHSEHHAISHPVEHHEISHGHHETSHSGHHASSHASLKQYHSEAHPIVVESHHSEHHTISHPVEHHSIEHSGHYESSHSGHHASSHASYKQHHSEAHPVTIKVADHSSHQESSGYDIKQEHPQVSHKVEHHIPVEEHHSESHHGWY